MDIDWGALINSAVQCLVFTAIGLLLFGLSFMIVEKVTPFSVRKELEDDQNTALGVVIGAMIIGIAIIVAAAIQG